MSSTSRKQYEQGDRSVPLIFASDQPVTLPAEAKPGGYEQRDWLSNPSAQASDIYGR